MNTPGRWSLALRTVAVQVAVAVIVVAAGVAGAWVQAQRAGDELATGRAAAVADTIAKAPSVIGAVSGPTPTGTLQAFAENLRLGSDIDFVVIMSTSGIRYTHPDPTQIGARYIGTIAAAQRGGMVQEHYRGTLGTSTRVVVPVVDDGTVVGLVAVGIRIAGAADQVRAQIPVLLLAGFVAALLTGLANALLSRRVPRRKPAPDQGGVEMRDMETYF